MSDLSSTLDKVIELLTILRDQPQATIEPLKERGMVHEIQHCIKQKKPAIDYKLNVGDMVEQNSRRAYMFGELRQIPPQGTKGRVIQLEGIDALVDWGCKELDVAEDGTFSHWIHAAYLKKVNE
jgi:hypothetical protein